MMALFQKPHTPACTIKQGLQDGYAPSLRILDLGTELWKHFSKRGIKTVRDLVLLQISEVRAMLAERKYPEKDLARIQTALKNVGLKLDMSREEFKNYKNKKAS